MELWMLVVIVAACLVTEAFFSGSEIAVLACDKLRLRQRANAGDKGASLLLRMLEKPHHLFSITLVGTNLAVVGGTTVVTLSLVDAYGPEGDGYTMAIMSPLVLLFGEIVPKMWFRARANTVAPRIVSVLWVAQWVLSPLVFFVSRATDVFLRLTGVDEGKRRAFVTREELQMLMRQEATSGGQIAGAERRMIHRIFQFATKPVSDVMIPLADLAAVEQSDLSTEAVALVKERGFSRLPVYAERIDDVRGILHSFDLLLAREGETVGALMRTALFVPEMQHVDELLEQMRREGHGMAIVVDEYGGAVGVITVEDLLEEIVGEIEDEHDPRRAAYRRLGLDRYAVSARMPIDEVNEIFKVVVPRGDYQTLAGFILDRLRRLPREGEQMKLPGATLTVTRVSERAILEVTLELDHEGRARPPPPRPPQVPLPPSK